MHPSDGISKNSKATADRPPYEGSQKTKIRFALIQDTDCSTGVSHAQFTQDTSIGLVF
jgi:hypothetical protein